MTDPGRARKGCRREKRVLRRRCGSYTSRSVVLMWVTTEEPFRGDKACAGIGVVDGGGTWMLREKG